MTVNVDRLKKPDIKLCMAQRRINDREKMTINEQVMKGLTRSALRKSPLFAKLIAIWTACIFSANSQIAKISFVQLSE